MKCILAPIPLQYEDASGNVLSGGYINVFLHGGTVNARIFSDADALSMCTNPVMLDSHGKCRFFVAPDDVLDYFVYDRYGNLFESYEKISSQYGSGDGSGIFKAVYGSTSYTDVKGACKVGMILSIRMPDGDNMLEMPASYEVFDDKVVLNCQNPNANISHIVTVDANGWSMVPGFVQHGYSEVQANVQVSDVRMKNGTITKVDIANSGTYTLNFIAEKPISGYGAFAQAFFSVPEDSELSYMYAYLETDDGWKELPILGYNPPFKRGKTYLVEIVGEVARITFMDYTPQPEPTIEVEAWMMPDEETAWMWTDGSVIALPDGETFNLLAPNGDTVLAPNGDNVIVNFGG